jgi:hypothetical protein
MNEAKGTIAAVAAVLLALIPAQAALAGDPEPRPSKLAFDQATLPPGQFLQDRFTPGGGVVQMYYRCEPGVTGRIDLASGFDTAPATGAEMRCDDEVHWVRNVQVRVGRKYTVRLRVENPGFAGYSVWGRR